MDLRVKTMNKDIKMSVSSMTRNKDKKAVYVFFQDGDTIFAMAKQVNPIKAMMGR